jgi:DNA-binding NarL/FixJ family response regulator
MAPLDTLRGEFVRVANCGLSRDEFARDATRMLRRAVPFDGVSAIWFDPATGLAVDTWIDDGAELHEADVSVFRQLAASGRRAASTGDRLRAVRVSESGMWGAIVLRRDPGSPSFTTRDADLLASLANGCDEVQRTRLEQDLAADAGAGDTGMLLLDDDDRVEMTDPAAADWLDELGANGRVPVVVTAVADQARAIAAGHSDVAAMARARTPSGRWVLVRGSVLGDGTSARTAIALEPARAPELADLIADAYGLTARERQVTELVAQGLANAAIGAQLFLSTYTVQDHLKAIFEKLDVSSRGELVARLYVDHRQIAR